MDGELRWLSGSGGNEVMERRFDHYRDSHTVPGVAWSRAEVSADAPLVLLGHGGSGHKRDSRIVQRAKGLVRQAHVVAVAIDGPHHGERPGVTSSYREYQERIVAEGIDTVADRMADDWVATVRALDSAGVADGGRVAYVGVSMGARFGIPAAAALGNVLRCAVLGKFGLVQVAGFATGYQNSDRIRSDASKIEAPTLQHVQWDDELFPLSGQLDLFEQFASPAKQLVAQPGPHTLTRDSAERAWREFVIANL